MLAVIAGAFVAGGASTAAAQEVDLIQCVADLVQEQGLNADEALLACESRDN
ncbi:hypothetical protein ACH347_35930 [Saccharopolyspora sp. 5N102]|uniref:hypothetical protein n=1 Tax=Saccharopolyspora sp. 5N102 TaxID=3375155 RepID=UPI003798A39B